MDAPPKSFLIFFFNDTATTEIYTLSLPDALPISTGGAVRLRPTADRGPTVGARPTAERRPATAAHPPGTARSEEHTSELQSLAYLVCRLLLEKKKYTRLPKGICYISSRQDLYSRH